jgi:hypothetical protein
VAGDGAPDLLARDQVVGQRTGDGMGVALGDDEHETGRRGRATWRVSAAAGHEVEVHARRAHDHDRCTGSSSTPSAAAGAASLTFSRAIGAGRSAASEHGAGERGALDDERPQPALGGEAVERVGRGIGPALARARRR